MIVRYTLQLLNFRKLFCLLVLSLVSCQKSLSQTLLNKESDNFLQKAQYRKLVIGQSSREKCQVKNKDRSEIGLTKANMNLKSQYEKSLVKSVVFQKQKIEKKTRNMTKNNFWKNKQQQQRVPKVNILQRKQRQQIKNDKQYKFSLKNEFKDKQSVSTKEIDRLLQSTTQVELIQNGNFNMSTCGTIFCVYNTKTFKESYIPNWQPDPQIQVGIENFYIVGSSKTSLAGELTGTNGTCIKQTISKIPKGVYTLSYRYGAKVACPLKYAQIWVYLNSTLIDYRAADNNEWNWVRVENISIGMNEVTLEYKMCGNPKTVMFGVAVTEISLRRSGDLVGENTATSNRNSANKNGGNTNATNTTTNTTTIITNTTNTTNTTSTTTITTNRTSPSNSTLSTSTNSESTSASDSLPLSSSNSTNSTASNEMVMKNAQLGNNRTIPDVQTNSKNSSETNNTTGLGVFAEEQSQQFMRLNQLQNQLSYYEFAKSFLFPLTQNPFSLSKFPIGRQLVLGVGSFFVNLDHLFLYVYHQRNYSPYLVNFFFDIHALQNNRWSYVQQSIKKYIYNFQQVSDKLSFKLDQTKPFFTYIQLTSSQFLTNNYEFFLFNLPLVVVLYFVLRFINNIMKKYHINGFFTSFSFTFSLILILLDGNSQFFAYFLLFDLNHLFSKIPIMKLLNLSSILNAFVLITLLISGPFILKYLQQHHKHQLQLQNYTNTLKASTSFVVEFGLFNLVLGTIHLMAQKLLDLQLLLLFVAEMFFIAFIISVLAGKKKVFQSKFKVLSTILFSFLRVNLIANIFFYNGQLNGMKKTLQQHQQVCILIYLSLFFSNFVYCVMEVLVKVFKQVVWKCKQIIKSKREFDEGTQLQRRMRKLSSQRHCKNRKVAPLNILETETSNLNEMRVTRIKTIRLKREEKVKNKTQLKTTMFLSRKLGESPAPSLKKMGTRSTRSVIHRNKKTKEFGKTLFVRTNGEF